METSRFGGPKHAAKAIMKRELQLGGLGAAGSGIWTFVEEYNDVGGRVADAVNSALFDFEYSPW